MLSYLLSYIVRAGTFISSSIPSCSVRFVSSCVRGGSHHTWRYAGHGSEIHNQRDSRCARLAFVLTLPLLVLILIFVSTPDVSAASIKLAWNPSPEPLVTGYRLYYGRSSGVYAVVVDAGNRTDYTVTGLDAGLTYYFTATAYTGAGDESTFSNETSYTIPGSSPAPDAAKCFIQQRRRMLHRHGGLRERACARGGDVAGVS